MSPRLKLNHDKALMHEVVGVNQKESAKLGNYLDQILSLNEDLKASEIAERINKHPQKERVLLISFLVMRYMKRTALLKTTADSIEQLSMMSSFIRSEIGTEKKEVFFKKLLGGIFSLGRR